MTDTIYQRPDDYDLEHADDERDIAFYRELIRRLAPRRLVELACGSGRITLPLAELGADEPMQIIGVDSSEEMLAHAREKCRGQASAARSRLSFTCGDIRSWIADEPADVILLACSSITHLLTLDDQLAVWGRAFTNLRPGGRFVVDVTMPDLRAYADSLQTRPRALVEVDVDATDEDTGRRLVRFRTTRFDAYEQRASIRFFYDHVDPPTNESRDRYVSDLESHVYFPRELQLLYRHCGFAVEHVWADFTFRAAHSRAREIVMCGQRPKS
jgi:SAM-dependent methyltransferase